MNVTRLPSGKFYGRLLKSIEVTGFRLTESIYAPGTVLPRHAHERSHFNYVLDGTYQERFSRQDVVRRRSAVLFLPSDVLHEEVHTAAGRHFLIEVDDRYFARFGNARSNLREPLDLSGGEGRRLVRRMYQEFSNADDYSHLVLEGLGLELLTLAARRWQTVDRRPPQWLVRVREQLEVEFAEPFSLAGLARTAGVHPVHLSQSFRRWFKCTVGEFVRELRLNSACEALVHSDAPLADIALDCGFTDQSHLCRVFKRMKGTSPRIYQRIAKAKG